MVKRLVNFDVSIPCQMEVEIPDDIANSSSDRGLRWARREIENLSYGDALTYTNLDDIYNEHGIDNVEFADAHEFESEPDEDEDWTAGEDNDLIGSQDVDSDPYDVDGPEF